MRFDVVGLAVFQINAATIGFVSGSAGSKMLAHVIEALVIRFPILVLFCVEICISAMPDLGDELFALCIATQLSPGVQLIGRKDRLNVSKPINKGLIGFSFDLARLGLRIEIWSRLLRESLREQGDQPNQDRDSNRIAS